MQESNSMMNQWTSRHEIYNRVFRYVHERLNGEK